MRILAISPHTDDAEIGCGATLAKLVGKGYDVFLWALSTGFTDSGSNSKEFLEAARRLGVKEKGLDNFEAREFARYRQHILDWMVIMNNNFKPHLVFTPSTANIHQDHVVVVEEAQRAFRTSCLLGYEMPWGDVKSFTNLLYWRVGANHLNIKIHALEAYESQKSRRYMNPLVIESMAMLRGVQVGADYAEAFEVLRWIF